MVQKLSTLYFLYCSTLSEISNYLHTEYLKTVIKLYFVEGRGTEYTREGKIKSSFIFHTLYIFNILTEYLLHKYATHIFKNVTEITNVYIK